MKMLIRVFAFTLLAGFSFTIHAGEPSKKSTKRELDTDLEARLYAGDYMNYRNYQFNMPILAAELDAKLRWRFARNLDFKANYKADILKALTSYSTSALFMDTYKQQLDLDLIYRKKGMRLDFFLDYTWMLRPEWPDYYQTQVAAGVLEFTPTDRYSYHKVKPGVKGKFKLNKEWDLLGKLYYAGKFPTIDPNWTVTHVTPRGYNGYGAEVGVEYSPKGEAYSVELSNLFERKHYSHLPARTAVAGSTNGGTNPLFVAFSNKTEIKAVFDILPQNMSIAPSYAIEFYVDEFEGYYSYVGHDFGVDFEHSLMNGKLEYEIGVGFKTLGYGPSSKDPAVLADGSPLYKNYITADAEVFYHFNKNLSMFIGADLYMKQSNFPVSLQSGTTPDDDILFSYDNFYIASGVEYRL